MRKDLDLGGRIEGRLARVLESASSAPCPGILGKALKYAVFPGGARVRPKLCLAIAAACEKDTTLAEGAAVSIELLHCASLVHDDLPCFDDAATRRGKPSLHVEFGEPAAVLVGDALIVLAFETLAHSAALAPRRHAAMALTVARSVGAPRGIVAGQAWELESATPLTDYQQAKTGSLFVAATVLGAQASGVDPEPWKKLGECIGEAYQVADDIWDVTLEPEVSGKPTGQDERHNRPSAVRELGLDGAVTKLKDLLAEGLASIPTCPGETALRQLIVEESQRFLPKGLAQRAA